MKIKERVKVYATSFGLSEKLVRLADEERSDIPISLFPASHIDCYAAYLASKNKTIR